MMQWKENNTELASGCPLHDPDINVKLVELDPAEYRDGTAAILYGFAKSPFGEYFAVLCPDGIAAMKFTEGNNEKVARTFLKRRGYSWLNRDRASMNYLNDILMGHQTCESIRVCVSGTPFQKEVWSALISIPFAETITYKQLAERLGRPQAIRAIASAVAQNSIAYLIPCHRVVRSDGSAGKYRWGSERKAAMIAWEKDMKKRLARKKAEAAKAGKSGKA